MCEIDRSYWYNDMCYAGFNLVPFKITENVY